MSLRLASYYFAYFAAVGVFLPYWPVYLQDRGFSASDIGTLLALYSLSRLAAPNLWGWLADRSGRRMLIVRGAGIATLACFPGVFWAGGDFVRLALVMALFCFFWTAALPQFEAVTLGHLGRDAHRYSRVRLWGSIGFILTALGGGPLFGHWGSAVVPWAMFALLGLILAVSLRVPESPRTAAASTRGGLGARLRHPAVWALVATGFLLQASHGPYYTFLTLYLREHGYSETAAGALWSLGVLAEITLFALLPRLLPHVGIARLLRYALALTVLRWLLLGSGLTPLPLLVAVQVLHAASFGLVHVSTLQLVQRYFGPTHAGQGQALYSSFGTGAGGAFGAWFAGWLWQALGGSLTFLLAAGLALAALLAATRLHEDLFIEVDTD